ncbi:endonuclease domain-containing protein [Nonomuraea sp. B5E05]|uniref:endonuclease domain-containing protein n=1 Tax=Nonomuraea sp. B5E05 TaxID=3153569 RepID=UPI003260B854
MAPGVALIWLPRNGEIVGKIPASQDNRRWLRRTVDVRSPYFDNRGYWHLPRTCLGRLVMAAIDRYGYVVLCRDMSKLSRCSRKCQEATGLECNCSCRGTHHGEEDPDGWFERVGDVIVDERGDFTRTFIAYGPKGSSAGAVIYGGQLQGRRYRVDRAGRKGWPKASAFMCAGCLTAPAKVWDHCHRHGYVRAPLCNTCNTRYWSGWHPQYGRTTPSNNLDTTYYRWCLQYDVEGQHPCSS